LIPNPPSGIAGCEVVIETLRNPQSAIRNPQSAIWRGDDERSYIGA